MAGIYVFWKPVFGTAGTGANHAFLLYQNDAGDYTDIARGGPQASLSGMGGLPSGGYDTGFGLGSVKAYAGAYSDDPSTTGSLDHFTSDQLAVMPSRELVSGTYAQVRPIWDQFGPIADDINAAQIPYTLDNSNSTVRTFVEQSGFGPNGTGQLADPFVGESTQPDMVRPMAGAHLDRVAAPVVGAVDQHAVDAGGAHLAEGDLGLAGLFGRHGNRKSHTVFTQGIFEA
jgi:hypothetical protein